MEFYKKHQREQLVFLVKIPLKFYDLAPRNGYMSFQRHILCFLFNQIIFIICVSFTWGNVDFAEDICANEISRNLNCFFHLLFFTFFESNKIKELQISKSCLMIFTQWNKIEYFSDLFLFIPLAQWQQFLIAIVILLQFFFRFVVL